MVVNSIGASSGPTLCDDKTTRSPHLAALSETLSEGVAAGCGITLPAFGNTASTASGSTGIRICSERRRPALCAAPPVVRLDLNHDTAESIIACIDARNLTQPLACTSDTDQGPTLAISWQAFARDIQAKFSVTPKTLVKRLEAQPTGF